MRVATKLGGAAAAAVMTAAVLTWAMPAAAAPQAYPQVTIAVPSTIVPSPATPFSAEMTLGGVDQGAPFEISFTAEAQDSSTGAITFANATATGPLAPCRAEDPAEPFCIWQNPQPSQTATMTAELVPDSFATGSFTITVWITTPQETTALATATVTIGATAGSVQIDVITTDDPTLRTQPARVDWSCTSGAGGSVVVQPGSASGSASGFIPAGSDCQASVSATGAAGGVTTTQSATAAVGSGAPTTYVPTVDVEIIRPGETTTLTFTIAYVAEDVGASPPDVGAPDDASRPPARILPVTGADPLLLALLAGAGAVAIVGGLVLAVRRRA